MELENSLSNFFLGKYLIPLKVGSKNYLFVGLSFLKRKAMRCIKEIVN